MIFLFSVVIWINIYCNLNSTFENVTLSNILNYKSALEYVIIYGKDQNGNIIETYGPFLAEGNPIRLDFASSYTGNYFLDVGATNDNGYGWYEISLDLYYPLPTDDYSADTNTTGRLEVGGIVNGQGATVTDRNSLLAKLKDLDKDK